MKARDLVLVALLMTLASLAQTARVRAQAPTANPIVAGSRYVWDQPAATVAEAQSYSYRLYKDGQSGNPVVAVVCTAPTASSPAGTFPCTAPFVAETPGISHSMQLTAMSPGGIESKASDPYSYIVVVQTATPRNLRKQ